MENMTFTEFVVMIAVIVLFYKIWELRGEEGGSVTQIDDVRPATEEEEAEIDEGRWDNGDIGHNIRWWEKDDE
jgi:hypothetical protein